MVSWFKSDPLSRFSNADLRHVALDIVWPVTPPMSAYWGDTLEKCDREQELVNAQRFEFENYEPARMRRAIMGWLDFCDRRIKEARRDIETQASVKRMKKYDAERERKNTTSQQVREVLVGQKSA